jgi:hypothetical protein
MRVMLAEQFFTFVTAQPVEKPNGEMLVVSGTTNEAERTPRSPAQARGTGRTNKTVCGARRQTVIVSVLESLRQHLSTFTLSSVIEELRRWCETGRSCFARRVEKLGLTDHGRPDDGRLSLLDRVIPVPDGYARLVLAPLWSLTASAAGGKKMLSRPYPRVSFQSTVTKNLKFLRGFTFSYRQGKIGLVPFNLTSRRAPGVERLLANYGRSGMSWITGDGKVDINDLAIVLSNYGQNLSSSGAATAAVPEPPSLGLLLAAIVSAILFLRRLG